MLTRREMVKGATMAAAAMVLQGGAGAWADGMPTRPLGKTGHRVRLFSLGGQATLQDPSAHDQALQIIHRALDLGVNYIDTSPKYGDGVSERYLGEALVGRRSRVFLASKTHEWGSRDASLRLLEQSLKRLRTDYLDLWQIHMIWGEKQLDEIFAKGGCLEALRRAREERMVRFLGVTGHYDPLVLSRAIQHFEFDTVLLPINPADRHPLSFTERWMPFADRHRMSFIERVLPLANEKKMGIIGMKVTARGQLFRSGGLTTMKQALDYALSLPVSTVVVGCDTVQQLEENVTLASTFTPLPPAEMAKLEQLTAGYAAQASYFKRGGKAVPVAH
jgi:aryl-alcohol dehydrogenase-like predicted oxidoreductase